MQALIAIARRGREPVYNVASAANVTNADLAAIFEAREIPVTVRAQHPAARFAPISIERLKRDTGFCPQPALPRFSARLDRYLSMDAD